MIDMVEVDNVAVSLFNHEDVEPIEDDRQAVVETEVNIGGDLGSVIIQDLFDDRDIYSRVDAFVHSVDLGCREITIIE